MFFADIPIWGCEPIQLHLSVLLNAIADLSLRKHSGSDCIPAEAVLSAGHAAWECMRNLFENRINGVDVTSPTEWHKVIAFGFAKTAAPAAFSDWPFIMLISQLKKLYSKCLTEIVWPHIQPHIPCTSSGFMKKRQPSECIEACIHFCARPMNGRRRHSECFRQSRHTGSCSQIRGDPQYSY